MAISVRKNAEELLLALQYAHNTCQTAFSNSVADGYFHRDATQTTNGPLFSQNGITVTTVTVTAVNATSLATSMALANQLFGILEIHMRDSEVHLLADVVNISKLDGYQNLAAVDLPSTEVLLNAIKSIYNTHLTQSGIHQINDTTNSVSTPNATDQTTANNLANQLKTSLNAHMGSCPTGQPRVRVIAD